MLKIINKSFSISFILKIFKLIYVSLHPDFLKAICWMQNIRNIAIIAHVDHGKTTTVDKILHTCQLFRDNQDAGELILDNNDLERERGITIVSKTFRLTIKGPKSTLLILQATPTLVARLNAY